MLLCIGTGHSAAVEPAESVHEVEKPYDCDAKFAVKQGYISTAPDENKPFQCSMCDVRFGLKQNMNRHIRQIHEKSNIQKYGHYESTHLNLQTLKK